MKFIKKILLFIYILIVNGLIAQCKIDSLTLVNYPYVLDNNKLKDYLDNFCFDKRNNAILLKDIVINRIKSGKPNSFEVVELAITGYAYAKSEDKIDIISYDKGLQLLDSVQVWFPSFSEYEKIKLLQLKYHFFENSNTNTESIQKLNAYNLSKILLLKELTKKQNNLILNEAYKLLKYYYDYAMALYYYDPIKNKEEALSYLHKIEVYNIIGIEDNEISQKFRSLYEAMALRKIIWLRGNLRELEVSKFKLALPSKITELHAEYIIELGGEYPPAFWYK